MMRDCLKKKEKRNGVYTIHGGDYNRKLDPSPRTNPLFYASPRSGDARLIKILVLCLIVSPQRT